jgi:signal transduction histidine kinase
LSPGVVNAILPDGRQGRVAALKFIPRRSDGDVSKSLRRELIVAVGCDTIEVMKTLSHLSWFLSSACVACLITSAAVLRLIVRRLMKPIDDVALRISILNADDLSVRIAPDAIPSELLPVTERLDDLLQRLHLVFAREKAFTANVAHELRTPLAGLRTTMEVTLSKARNPETYQEAMNECLAICHQMQDLVDNLLSLSQLESGKVKIARGPFDLSRLLRDCWKPYAKPAASRGILAGLHAGDALLLDSDREHLRVVLRNLFDNAVSYTNDGGTITCEAVRRGSRCVISVRNSGCTLSKEQLGQVFNRFWRADASRSAKGMHCGIGLSLCQKIVELLGGTISVTVDEGQFFTVTVSLPDDRPALVDLKADDSLLTRTGFR